MPRRITPRAPRTPHTPRTPLIALITLTALAALTLALTAAGCTGRTQPPSTDPSIRGTITTLTVTMDRASALVEAEGEPLYSYDKATVGITSDTKLLRATGEGAYERITLADLAVGQQVDVWFEGPVAESYPVQATAGTLVVLK